MKVKGGYMAFVQWRAINPKTGELWEDWEDVKNIQHTDEWKFYISEYELPSKFYIGNQVGPKLQKIRYIQNVGLKI